MLQNTCPKSDKCPIFKGGVLKRAESEEIYRSVYCNAGEAQYTSCMRYIASMETGKPVPLSILPNSTKSLDEIVDLINRENPS